ncbi:hypothetical protein [Enterocloster sp.]
MTFGEVTPRQERTKKDNTPGKIRAGAIAGKPAINTWKINF